uniref:Uncharacterized protein n=1 Tax=Arundo donax TaxID=35708 RepID=A0A0A9CXY8_ARUDO
MKTSDKQSIHWPLFLFMVVISLLGDNKRAWQLLLLSHRSTVASICF